MKSVLAGPTGSLLSTTTTSNVSLYCLMNLAASSNLHRDHIYHTFTILSAYFNVSLGSPNAEAVEFEKNCLETSTTILSISHMTMDSTPSCRATSRSTPPSPPPIIRTLGSHFHDECKHIYLLFLFSNVLNVSTHCTTNYTHYLLHISSGNGIKV